MPFNDTDHEITKIDVLKEQKIGEAFDAVAAASIFGVDWANSAELTLALFGGPFYDGSTIIEVDDWEDDLAPSATNYVEATAAGVVSVNQSGFTAGRIQLYEIVTTADGISTFEEKRAFFVHGGNARFSGLTIASGTLTDSAPALNITQTWNDAADTFVGADMNITDTASAAGSILQRWRVAGATMASILKSGAATLAGVLTAAGLTISAAGALGSPSLVMHSSDTTSGLYRPGANQIGLQISGAINTTWLSGAQVIGHTASLNFGSTFPAFQVQGTTTSSAAQSANRWSADTFGPTSFYFKSRGGLGAYTAVQASDVLGNIFFYGADGTAPVAAARLRVFVEGTVSTGVVGANMRLGTANPTTGTLADAVYIDGNQRVGIGAAAPTAKFHVSDTVANSDSFFVRFAGAFNSTVTGAIAGMQFDTTYAPAGASLTTLNHARYTPSINGSSIAVTNFRALSLQVNTTAGYTGQVTNASALNIENGSVAGANPFTNCFGINVAGTTNGSGTTTATIVNTSVNITAITSVSGVGGTMTNSGIAIAMPSGVGAGTQTNYGIQITGNGGTGTAVNWAFFSSSTASSQFAGPVSFAAGAVGAPGIYLSSDTTTGVYRPGANQIAVAVSGAQALLFTGTRIGMNATPTAVSLQVDRNIDGATTSIGVQSSGTVQSGVTASAYGFRSSISTQAAAFTLGGLAHFGVVQGTIGAGSTVTTQYGFFVSSGLTGGATNYAYYSGVNAASGRWNLYMEGTAQNYLAGVTGIGIAASSTATLALAASVAGVSSLRIPHGTAPSSPVDGDVWTTTAGFFIRINGVTKTVTLT